MNILLLSLPHFTSFHDSHSLCQYLRRRAIYYKIIDDPKRKKRKQKIDNFMAHQLNPLPKMVPIVIDLIPLFIYLSTLRPEQERERKKTNLNNERNNMKFINHVYGEISAKSMLLVYIFFLSIFYEMNVV